MALKLNGWQRLWVVVSILYLAVVVFFAYIEWPGSKELDTSTHDVSRERLADAESPVDKLLDEIFLKMEEERLAEVAAEQRSERFQVVVSAALFWIIPIVTLYIFGWLVGWIVRGFRKKDAS